jgi:hypothetical protein
VHWLWVRAWLVLLVGCYSSPALVRSGIDRTLPPTAVARGTADSDGDGLLDVDDHCPDEPEDIDGDEDDDGCPDPDVDIDPVLDLD